MGKAIAIALGVALGVIVVKGDTGASWLGGKMLPGGCAGCGGRG
jgi:hypothetical protein